MKWMIELHESKVNQIFNYYTLWLDTTEDLIPIGKFERLTCLNDDIVHSARRTKFDINKGFIDTEF